MNKKIFTVIKIMAAYAAALIVNLLLVTLVGESVAVVVYLIGCLSLLMYLGIWLASRRGEQKDAK